MFQRKWLATFAMVISAACFQASVSDPDAVSTLEPQVAPNTNGVTDGPATSDPAPAQHIRPLAGWHSFPAGDIRAVLNVEQKDSTWLFTDRASGAVLEVDAADVRLSDERIDLKEDAATRVLKEPSPERSEGFRGPATLERSSSHQSEATAIGSAMVGDQAAKSSAPAEAGAPAAKKSCAAIFGCARLTYCVGFVNVCCSTNKVIGACFGAWDCGCPPDIDFDN